MTAAEVVLPRVLRWKALFESERQEYLSPIAREVVEIKLHFLIYTLLRFKVHSEVFDGTDVPAGFQVLSSILPSILHIVQSWLSAADHVQFWKSSYKFYFGTAIISLFDIFKETRTFPQYEPVTAHYALYQHCEEILQAAPEWHDRPSALPISKFGLILLQNRLADI